MKYKDFLQGIGGLLVIILIILVFVLIWVPDEIVLKLIGTVVLGIILIYILEKSAK